MDNAPELAVPSLVELGEICTGIATTHTITIANKGGGTLEGNVTAHDPWSVEPASYKLGRGQQAALRLTLTPDAEQEYQGRLHFSSDPKVEPALHAHAVAPFTVEPVALELAADPTRPARSASFTLTNRTAAPLTLAVEANERLHLPAQIALPPHGSQTLTPALAPGDQEGMEGAIRLFQGVVFRKINVHAASLESKAEPTPAPLPQARATPSPVASYPALLPPLRAPITGPEAPPAAATKSASANAEELPRLTGLAVLRATSDGTAEFAWDPPTLPVSIGEPLYRMEVRRLTLDANHKLAQNWIAIPGVQFGKRGNRLTGLVTGIPPGISDTLHVVALTGRGEPCAVSVPLAFHIPAPVKLFTLRNGVLAGFVLMLLAALALRFKEKRME